MDEDRGDEDRGDEDRGDAARALARLARVLERAPAPLTLQQYRMLTFLGAGGSRATSVAGHLAVTKPSVTAAVEALTVAGYLRREVESADRRAARLEVTPAGRDALACTDRAYALALEQALEDLPGGPEALAALARVWSALPPAPPARPAGAGSA